MRMREYRVGGAVTYLRARLYILRVFAGPGSGSTLHKGTATGERQYMNSGGTRTVSATGPAPVHPQWFHTTLHRPNALQSCTFWHAHTMHSVVAQATASTRSLGRHRRHSRRGPPTGGARR